MCEGYIEIISDILPDLLQKKIKSGIIKKISELLKIPENINNIKKFGRFILNEGNNITEKKINLILSFDTDINLTGQRYIIEPSLEKLYNNKTFIIKKELKDKWLRDQCSNNAKKIGEFILNITRHVSYIEFQEKLLASIRNIPLHKKYIIYIETNVDDRKSSLWISAIFINKIQDLNLPIKILDIIYSYDEYKDLKLFLYSDMNVDIIICDDGTYSGLQLISILSNLLHYNNRNNIYCLIPFMSNKSVKKINDMNKSNIILLNVDIIETIKERSLKLGINIPELDLIDRPGNKIQLNINVDSDIIQLGKYLNHYFPNLRNNFPYNLIESSMPFYFDHKIADYISTFPIIYQYGFIKLEMGCPTTVPNSLLFDNCDTNPTYESLDIKTYSEQCIIPYYKTIDIEINAVKEKAGCVIS